MNFQPGIPDLKVILIPNYKGVSNTYNFHVRVGTVLVSSNDPGLAPQLR